MIDKVIKSFIWHLLGAVILFVFQYVGAAILGADEFGKANYLLGYSSIIMLFSYFGVQNYIPKVIAEKESKEQVMGEAVATLSTMFIAISLIFYIFIKKYMENADIIIVILISYSMLILEVISAYYVGIKDQTKGSYYRRFIYSLGTFSLFFIMLIFFSKGYYLYIIPQIIVIVFIAIPHFWSWRKNFKFNFKLIKNAWPFYISQIGYSIYIYSAKILQKNFIGFSSVAVLSISLSIGSIANMFGENFSKISMPEFVGAWKYKNIKKIKEIYNDCTRLNSYLVLPIVIAIVVNSTLLLNVLGDSYKGKEFILVSIILSQVINSFMGPNGSLLNMTGYQAYEVRNGYLKSIIGFIIAFAIGKKYVWGIAISIALSEVIINIVKMIQIKKVFNFYPFEFKTLSYIVINGVVQVVSFTIISNKLSFIGIILVTPVAVLVFYVLQFYFSPCKEDKDIINNIIYKIYKRKA